MRTTHFADRLLAACAEKNSRLVVGLDPHAKLLPPHLLQTQNGAEGNESESMHAAIVRFNAAVIEAVADIAVAVKPQLALYEQWGAAGWRAYEETVRYAQRHDLLVIADGKRNDIGSSAEGYATAFLGPVEASGRQVEADAVTVNPYLGSDGIEPFVQRWQRGKGVFALVRTSNPSARQLQDLTVDGRPLYLEIARLVEEWGAPLLGAQGYSALGAVVGGTDPAAAMVLRQAMPHSLFLVPGFGAQGADAQAVAAAFDADGYGAVVNSSRDIIFAYRQRGEERNYASAARQAALEASRAINAALA